MADAPLDLAIVGGGPAGISTALFLAASAPHLVDRIVVLEKEAYPRDKICAGAIGARADRALASIGVRVDVPSAPVRGLSVVAKAGSIEMRAAGSAVIGRVVRRIEFDAAFADQARARGIRIMEGARVTGLEERADGVRIQTTRGDVDARAVVGADGVGSVVRRAMGLPRGPILAQVVEVDTPGVRGDRPPDFLHFDVTEPVVGYGWDFPTVVGGRALVCRGFYELREGERDADVADRLGARLEARGINPASLRIKRFAERGLSLHVPTARRRVLLVGEAAGIDPVLGEGIPQAILYGASAGPWLAEQLERGTPAFDEWPRAFRRSRVGLDLGIRTRALPWIYTRARPLSERWVTGSHALAKAGMQYFAGERVSRTALARAAFDLARCAILGG